MKILIDARTLGSEPTGIGIYTYNFAKALSEFDDFEIVLVSDIAESIEINELKSVHGIRVNLYGRRKSKGPDLFNYFKYIRRCIQSEKPDIFWEPNNLLPVNIKNPYGKYVVTIHDIFPVTMGGQSDLIFRLYFRYGLRKTLGCCDAVLYDTTETKKDLETRFKAAADIDNFISYIIVDETEMNIERRDYFLYVGNLEWRKGTDILLDAYIRYIRLGGTKELYAAGKIRESRIAEKVKAVSEQTDKFHYLGYIDYEEKNRLMHECGCFLFPSRAEGFGIPVIEAALSGTHIITGNLEVFKELLNGNAGSVPMTEDYRECVKNFSDAMAGPGTPGSDLIPDRDFFSESRLAGRLKDYFLSIAGFGREEKYNEKNRN